MAITIEDIDTKINELVASPKVSYSIGNKSVSSSDYIAQLIRLREHLAAVPQTDLAIMQFDFDIGLDGADNEQTVVEL